MLSNKIAQKILEQLKIKYKSILNPQKGYRNTSFPIILKDNSKINLIIYKNEPDILSKIKTANNVSNFLAEQGFPTRHTINKIIQIKTKHDTRYACLYNYLEGETIPWEAYTMDHIKLLGMTMAILHKKLKMDSPLERGLTGVIGIHIHILSRMQRYFADINVLKALEAKLKIKLDLKIFQRFSKILKITELLQDKQILHMDFVRGNILFQKSKLKSQNSNIPLQVWRGEGEVGLQISGILDFEKTSYGPPIFDIARTLAFLIVDCKYKSEEKIRKYFLKSGYIKRGKQQIKNEEINLLDELVNFFLLYDFYKFLKHNPYEFLQQNEHYLRTVDKLIQTNVIQPV